MRELKRRGWIVRLWSLVAAGEPSRFADPVRELVDEVVLVRREVTSWRRYGQLALDLVARRAFQAHWFWTPRSAEAANDWLADLEAEPIFVEQLYMYPFVPEHLRGRIILDTQNHEAARMASMARSDGGFGRRAVARLQTAAVNAYEREALGKVALVLAVSCDEATEFETSAPDRVRVIPNGVDASAVIPAIEPPRSSTLLFIGSLSYSANRDAIRYLTDAIGPRLRGTGATVTIVGSSPRRVVQEMAARAPVPVSVTGYVADVAPYFSASRVMIVPLRHGGGTRLKILEALAHGLPIVTTRLGGAGLDLVHGTHALIADEPGAFAKAVERLLRDDELWIRLSSAGRALVEERFDWALIGDAFDAAVREVATMPP